MVGVLVIQATATFVEVDPRQGRVNSIRTELETGLPATTDAEHDKVAEVLTALLQRDIEVWTPEAALPVDEETLAWSGPSPSDADEMTARYGERMRWEKQGPDWWLVSTEDFITIAWNGERYVPTVRVARS